MYASKSWVCTWQCGCCSLETLHLAQVPHADTPWGHSCYVVAVLTEAEAREGRATTCSTPNIPATTTKSMGKSTQDTYNQAACNPGISISV